MEKRRVIDVLQCSIASVALMLGPLTVGSDIVVVPLAQNAVMPTRPHIHNTPTGDLLL